MRTEVNINPNLLTWAIARAGYDLDKFIAKKPSVQEWIDGDKNPTIKQLEAFSKKVYIPFGYLFLPSPPRETLPIPFFRTNQTQSTQVSINVYDTILLLQQRQDWLKEYLYENDFEPLTFVGSQRNSSNVNEIVKSIRQILGLSENWASSFKTWEDTLNHLVETIEDKGIITTFNGVVENNTHRKIKVDECRGFVLVDPMAPFMFVNNSDSKAAQMFTLAHELAHIWTGQSAGFDFRQLQPAADANEQLCDRVAAEFLVPEATFNRLWSEKPSIEYVARFFKVSQIVIARRAFDTGKITRSEFFRFYEAYISRDFAKKVDTGPGGDFYATTRKRISRTFATHIINAVKSGQLLYRDAYKLTSLKGDTFQKFFSEHI